MTAVKFACTQLIAGYEAEACQAAPGLCEARTYVQGCFFAMVHVPEGKGCNGSGGCTLAFTT